LAGGHLPPCNRSLSPSDWLGRGKPRSTDLPDPQSLWPWNKSGVSPSHVASLRSWDHPCDWSRDWSRDGLHPEIVQTWSVPPIHTRLTATRPLLFPLCGGLYCSSRREECPIFPHEAVIGCRPSVRDVFALLCDSQTTICPPTVFDHWDQWHWSESM